MIALLLSLAVLAAGPPLAILAMRVPSVARALDAFVLVSVFGLIGLHVLPDGLRMGGWWAVAAALLGFFGPTAAERGLHAGARGLRWSLIVLAVFGLFLHAIMDGMGIAAGDLHVHDLGGDPGHAGHDHAGPSHAGHSHAAGSSQGSESLVWAIVLHRLPVGIGIWWILARTAGKTAAFCTLGVVALGTLLGYGVDVRSALELSPTGIGVFHALLSGSLLHVILHAHVPRATSTPTAPAEDAAPPPPSPTGEINDTAPPVVQPSDATSGTAKHAHHDHGAPPRRSASMWRANTAGLLGAIAAGFVVWGAVHGPVNSDGGPSFAEALLHLTVESAPALLAAWLLVGFAHVFVPDSWLRRATGGSLVGQAMRGMAIGLPLPVCSCGVVPLYRDLASRGAGIAAAIAFLVATPELEFAAVLLTWQLMGPEIAIARVITSAVLAVGLGIALGAWFRNRVRASDAEHAPDCEVATANAANLKPPMFIRIRKALSFGYGEAVDHTGPWIVLGLVLSAFLVPYIDGSALANIDPMLAVPAAALVGLPIYVCASGTTPFAAILVAEGLSPGAAIAFLLTGPATNITTFGVLKSLHGKAFAAAFGAGMFFGTVMLGWLMDAVLDADVTATARAVAAEQVHTLATWQWVALTLLVLVFLGSLARLGVRGFLHVIGAGLFGASPFEGPNKHAGHDHSTDSNDCCH